MAAENEVQTNGTSPTSIRFDDNVAQLIALAKKEDLGAGDVTTALIADGGIHARFELLAKQQCVFAGREIAETVLNHFDPALRIEWADLALDGVRIEKVPTTLAVVTGTLGSLLAAERVLLNFLQRLCGVATLTRRFVDAVEGTGARILDTRKTTPGWRALEKYAVRCGGGSNHRKGLHDAVLIKDNHLAGAPPERLAAAVFEMLNRIPLQRKPAFIQVEAANLGQFEQLCKVVGIDVVLLDNFSRADINAAVSLRRELGLEGRIDLEVSGGITLDTVRAIAETGVERISVGAITHSATAVDFSLERVPC